jgi:hypothetical protein
MEGFGGGVRGFWTGKEPRVRDGRGSRLVGELAEPPATGALAQARTARPAR